MVSRKDQLHSYQFLLQRVISALVMRETDPPQAPLRRGTGAVFLGVMVAVVVAAVFGIVGLLTKVGGDRWRTTGGAVVVVERETGAAYVFSDGTLTPMRNYSSALLIADGSPPSVFKVARRALAGVPRNPLLGIDGAPNTLPGRSGLVRGSWTLCSRPGTDSSDVPAVTTTLVVGAEAEGGRPLGEDALLTRDPAAGVTWLIWRGTRYKLAEAAQSALFGLQQDVVEVGTAWLNGLPEGAEIAPIELGDRGAPSVAVYRKQVGDLLVHSVAAGRQYYLVRADGLEHLTSLQHEILTRQYPAVVQGYITTADIARIPTRPQLHGDAPASLRPPEVIPRLAESPRTGAVCAVSPMAASEGGAPGGGAPGGGAPGGSATDGAEAAHRIVVDATLPAVSWARGVPTTSQTAAGTSLADRVALPPGKVALLRFPPGGFLLVTDSGMRFAVPSAQVLATLGFSAADAVEVPAGLVNRIPAGPTLDPQAAAAAPAPVGARRP